jgi:protein involved in ribonucleotide reduction
MVEKSRLPEAFQLYAWNRRGLVAQGGQNFGETFFQAAPPFLSS